MNMENRKIINVGIAEMDVVRTPDLIRTSGLGSCVGVILYDLDQELAGLAHVMLPDSNLSRNNTIHPAKYADTAVPALLDRLVSYGASRKKVKAKIAGGAQMFKISSKNDMMKIGLRNIEAVKKELERLTIPLIAEDVGGNRGRTIIFNPKSGILTIRTVNLGSKEI